MSVAQLVFDSRQIGKMTGSSGTCAMDRALLFRAGPLTIDLILQGQEDTDAFVCGQVVDEVTSEPLAGVQIWLGDDGQPLQTDAFGQFRMTESIDETRPSHLRVRTPRGELTCAIPAVA